jgi:hypothetical protein
LSKSLARKVVAAVMHQLHATERMERYDVRDRELLAQAPRDESRHE